LARGEPNDIHRAHGAEQNESDAPVFSNPWARDSRTTPLFLEDEREGRASRPSDMRDGSESLHADRKTYVSFQIRFHIKYFPRNIENKSEKDREIFRRYILVYCEISAYFFS